MADLENNLAGKRDILTVFADKNRLSESRPAAETAALFGIDGNLTAELYQLSGKERMSLAEFLQAIEDYSGAAAAVPSGLMEQIEMAALFTDREEYAKERTASELSQLFGVDESLLTKLLKLSGKKTASIESLITMISSNSLITSMLPSDITEKLYLVAILTNPDEMSKKRTADEVSNLLGIDRSLLSIMGNESMSIDELMQLAKKMAAVPDLTSMRESESFTRMRQIMSDTEKDKKYTSLEMTELLESMTGSRNEGEIALAYTVYASQKFPVINKMSLEQFFQYVTVMSESAEYAELFDDGVRKSLSKASGELADMRRQFVGEEHSVMTISILLSEEPEEIDKLYDAINKTLRKSVRGKYYLVGNIPLQRELEKDYAREFNGIWIPMAVLFILPGAVELSGRGIRRIRKK